MGRKEKEVRDLFWKERKRRGVIIYRRERMDEKEWMEKETKERNKYFGQGKGRTIIMDDEKKKKERLFLGKRKEK